MKRNINHYKQILIANPNAQIGVGLASKIMMTTDYHQSSGYSADDLQRSYLSDGIVSVSAMELLAEIRQCTALTHTEAQAQERAYTSGDTY